MKSAINTKHKLNAHRKEGFRRRVYALRGKYKGKGLMKAFLAEKEREKNR